MVGHKGCKGSDSAYSLLMKRTAMTMKNLVKSGRAIIENDFASLRMELNEFGITILIMNII